MASNRTLKRRAQRRKALYRSIDEMAGFECDISPIMPSIGLDYFVKLQQTNVKTAQKKASPAPQLEDKTMNLNQLPPEKNYLLSRIDEIFWSRKDDLHDKFNLRNDPLPKTYAEMRERLLAGKFTLPKDREPPYNAVYLEELIWRDPELKEDWEGYEKAVEKLSELKTHARDEVVVHDQATGLKSLETFKSATLH